MKNQKINRLTLQRKNEILTLGELIFSTYRACGSRVAPKVLDMAMESHLILLKELRRTAV